MKLTPTFVLLASGIAAIFLIPIAALSHQDQIFEISTDGQIIGVPNKFKPASLLIQRDSKGKTSKASLRLSKGKYDFPECLLRLFDLPAEVTLSVHGSWYHSRSSMPPYLVIDLPQEVAPVGWFNGFFFTFNLRTAELLGFNEKIVTKPPDGGLVGSQMRSEPAYVRHCGGVEPKVEGLE